MFQLEVGVVEGGVEDYASDEFGSTARELSGAAGTASGAVANTNDNDDATFRYREGHNTTQEFQSYFTAIASFTIENFSLEGITSKDKEDIEDRFKVLRNMTQF